MSQRYEFFTHFARILNSGQARSVVLCGNVYDLFWDGQRYVPLIPFLCEKAQADRLLQLVYELNGPIRISKTDRQLLTDAPQLTLLPPRTEFVLLAVSDQHHIAVCVIQALLHLFGVCEK